MVVLGTTDYGNDTPPKLVSQGGSPSISTVDLCSWKASRNVAQDQVRGSTHLVDRGAEWLAEMA